MTDIPVAYTLIDGKKWIFIQGSMVIQCAYCIHVQALTPIRDDTGLVIALKMYEHEDHGVDCPQKVL